LLAVGWREQAIPKQAALLHTKQASESKVKGQRTKDKGATPNTKPTTRQASWQAV
jgi:hypothetical protein